MFDLDNWQEIWATISMNKSRSIMTGFGVFWGIFMLIVLVGVGFGLEDGVKGTMDGFETTSVFFGTNRTSEAYGGYRKGRWWSMEERDLDIIKNRVESVDLISPITWGSGREGNTVRGLKTGTYNNRGVYPDYFKVSQVRVLKGRLINDLDTEQKRKVCLIGREVYENLFDVGEEPIGEHIRLNGIYYQVVGVIEPISQVNFAGRDEESVFIPFTTMQQTFGTYRGFGFMTCSTKEGFTAAQLEEDVVRVLKEIHSISPTDTKAVVSMNIAKEIERVNMMMVGVNVLIWFVGIGALLSGVFGISNIMLVTVRERMREIGVKRALGATPMNILVQIMSESVVLTTIAGLIGFMFGIGVVLILQVVISSSPTAGISPPSVSFNMALLAMAILIVSGLIAGVLPTVRALQIKAIEAIQDE